jgi:hypothetical protein
MTRAHALWAQIETFALLQFSAIMVAEKQVRLHTSSVARNPPRPTKNTSENSSPDFGPLWEPALPKEVVNVDRGNYGTGCGKLRLARIGSVQD